MDIQEFNYFLPKDLISQKPIIPRDSCKLFVYNRKTQKREHIIFKEIIKFFNKGDTLVLNDTKVFPARMYGTKKTKGKIEVFLLNPIDNNFNPDKINNKWYVLLNKKFNLNEEIIFLKNNKVFLKGQVIQADDKIVFEFNKKGRELIKKIYLLGNMPIPPYIKNTNKKDLEKYQNVYAKNLGSCAAPTAGFHFTNNLLKKIKAKGVNVVYITLHVGLGTFKPIEVSKIEKHKMDKEYYIINKKTADILNKTRQNKNKIFAVGTTVVRTLESVYDNSFKEASGFTDIYIYPGHKFKAIDCFITNFHLPKSTPLMMLAGFINNEVQNKIKSKNILLDLYKEAIQKEYLFYSFGEAMLII